MELAKLRYFYTVAKHQHVTRAAEEIHIAQPALTKAIKQLEDELSAPLFYKKGRNVYLTECGVYLQKKLEGIFAQIDGIPEEIALVKEGRKRIVKLNVLAASTAVTDAVIGYKKKNADVVFQLIQNEAETDCDVSLSMRGVGAGALPAFREKTVLKESVYLAVPKNSPYGERKSIQLREVKEEGFVHLAGSRLFRAECDKFCAAAGFKPKTSFESDSIVAVRNVIAAHAGVGFWPEYSWGKSSADVKLLPISAPPCQRELVIGLHESRSAGEAAADFYAYLVKFLKMRSAQVAKKHGACYNKGE